MKKIKVLPDDCSSFTMDALDALAGLEYIIIQENEYIEEDYLCTVCVVSDCPDRKTSGPYNVYPQTVKH